MLTTSGSSRKFIINHESTIKSATALRTKPLFTVKRSLRNKVEEYQPTPRHKLATQASVKVDTTCKAIESSSTLDNSCTVQTEQPNRTALSLKSIQAKLLTIVRDRNEEEKIIIPTNSLGIPIKGLGFSEYSQRAYDAMVLRERKVRPKPYYFSDTKEPKPYTS